jgi:hypothetical protein
MRPVPVGRQGVAHFEIEHSRKAVFVERLRVFPAANV